ncbi:hypothetical protein PoB_007437200 [Plakobranchus ocellatus]|uniref:Uncharacterized protein n=1 Tax=Plakobranchus ocellatus TaxID=259542 RepID=A0AAV4DU64_9GAST|nr:hypothetical protein PoB_007437200 [Plakobranchus ocellatus]
MVWFPRYTQLWLGLTFIALLVSAAPVEDLDDAEEDDATPELTDLDNSTDTVAPPRSPLGGWASLINISRRRPSSDDRDSRSPLANRRSNQSGGRKRSEKNALAESEQTFDDQVSDEVKKSRGRHSGGSGRRGGGSSPVSGSPQQSRQQLDVTHVNHDKTGGRFSRGKSGRRGRKKQQPSFTAQDTNFDDQQQKSKPDGRRRSSSRPEQTDEASFPNVVDEATRSGPTFEEDASDPGQSAPDSSAECPDVLLTRAGAADQTIVALLTNIDEPDVIRPILDDITANLLNLQEEDK